MICEVCHGARWVETIIAEDGACYLGFEPCPACGGQAFTHCCDGECAQPDSVERGSDG